MEKIVILGSSGAGKSTLAKKLGSILKIKVFHMDRFCWLRGWKGKTGDTRIDILQELVRGKQWIIEGTYLDSSAPRLEAADTIIFLDTPPLLCLWRIIKRHWEYCDRPRRDIPKGCTDKLTLFRMLKVLAFPLIGRRTLDKKLHKYESKRIIRLHSDEEVKGFLAQIVQDADDKRNSSGKVPVAKEKLLAVVGR